jgi:uncharacterized protein YggU (UPF0235/DUF167 family)
MRLTIRVRPGAGRTWVGGSAADQVAGSTDHPTLVVRVTAPAVDGRATEAALRALADALGVRRREVALVRGATSRVKVVEVEAVDEASLRARVDALGRVVR